MLPSADADLMIHSYVCRWQEPGEDIPRTGKAVSCVLSNPHVSSILVAFASVAELEETLGSM